MKFKIVDKDGKKYSVVEELVKDEDLVEDEKEEEVEEEVEEKTEEEIPEIKEDAKVGLTDEEIDKVKELLEMFDDIKALVSPEEEKDEEDLEEVKGEEEAVEEAVENEEAEDVDAEDELLEEDEEEDEEVEDSLTAHDSKKSFGSIEAKNTQDSLDETIASKDAWQEYYDNLLKK